MKLTEEQIKQHAKRFISFNNLVSGYIIAEDKIYDKQYVYSLEDLLVIFGEYVLDQQDLLNQKP